MKQSSSLILLLLISLCATLSGCLSAIYSAGAHSDAAQWIKTQQAPISLSGEVRDNLGKLLPGVSVHIVRDYLVADFSEFGWDDRKQEDTRTINGRFHFSWSPSEHIHLTFKKSGYTPAEMTIDVQNTVPKGEFGTTQPPASPVSRTDCIVILHRE